MTYTQAFALAQDSTFTGQVMIAMMKAAVSIMTESAATAGHTQRVNLANAVLNNPTTWQPKFAYALASQTATITPQTVPSTVPDGTIDTAVSAVWDSIAGHSLS
jgi:hypothetical protein